MNYFFKSNAFARVWKIAEVTCVPNAGDAGNQYNNWPISLLPVLSKVNERLAPREFVTSLDNNNKPSQFQSNKMSTLALFLGIISRAVVSSTNFILRFHERNKLFVMIVNKMTPNLVPCGIPPLGFFHSDIMFSILTAISVLLNAGLTVTY